LNHLVFKVSVISEAAISKRVFCAAMVPNVAAPTPINMYAVSLTFSMYWGVPALPARSSNIFEKKNAVEAYIPPERMANIDPKMMQIAVLRLPKLNTSLKLESDRDTSFSDLVSTFSSSCQADSLTTGSMFWASTSPP